MQKITIITVGKLKEEFFKKAEQEYLKRLSSFAEITLVEIPQTILPADPSKNEINAALKIEGEQILAKIPKNSQIISLCIEGKHHTSEELSNIICDNATYGSGVITFIIGSSFGLADEIKQKSSLKLSMSKMTFPHRLAKIMLLEQIYRSFNIIAGTHYHK